MEDRAEKKLYRIKESARILSVSYQWLDRKIRDGVINVVWLGGQRLISAEEIDRLISQGVE